MDRGRPLLEICVDDIAGVTAAVAGGADRIELCSALALGGLTPSVALAAHAAAVGIPVHAMVRPRSGDFIYDDQELAMMVNEIACLRMTGVAGIVVGVTLADGSPDPDALGRLRDAARDLQIVLHRAVDLAPDPVAAVRLAVELGYDHVLSSGGALTAPAGAPVLAAMAAEAGARLQVIAGGGVRADNVAALVAESGVGAIHASASIEAPWSDERIVRFGFATGSRKCTSIENVAALAMAVRTAAAPA